MEQNRSPCNNAALLVHMNRERGNAKKDCWWQQTGRFGLFWQTTLTCNADSPKYIYCQAILFSASYNACSDMRKQILKPRIFTHFCAQYLHTFNAKYELCRSETPFLPTFIIKDISKKKPLLIPFENSNYLRFLGMEVRYHKRKKTFIGFLKTEHVKGYVGWFFTPLKLNSTALMLPQYQRAKQ
jgi:hypothetical protein